MFKKSAFRRNQRFGVGWKQNPQNNKVHVTRWRVFRVRSNVHSFYLSKFIQPLGVIGPPRPTFLKTCWPGSAQSEKWGVRLLLGKLALMASDGESWSEATEAAHATENSSHHHLRINFKKKRRADGKSYYRGVEGFGWCFPSLTSSMGRCFLMLFHVWYVEMMDGSWRRQKHRSASSKPCH